MHGLFALLSPPDTSTNSWPDFRRVQEYDRYHAGYVLHYLPVPSSSLFEHIDRSPRGSLPRVPCAWGIAGCFSRGLFCEGGRASSSREDRPRSDGRRGRWHALKAITTIIAHFHLPGSPPTIMSQPSHKSIANRGIGETVDQPRPEVMPRPEFPPPPTQVSIVGHSSQNQGGNIGLFFSWDCGFGFRVLSCC